MSFFFVGGQAGISRASTWGTNRGLVCGVLGVSILAIRGICLCFGSINMNYFQGLRLADPCFHELADDWPNSNPGTGILYTDTPDTNILRLPELHITASQY